MVDDMKTRNKPKFGQPRCTKCGEFMDGNSKQRKTHYTGCRKVPVAFESIKTLKKGV